MNARGREHVTDRSPARAMSDESRTGLRGRQERELWSSRRLALKQRAALMEFTGFGRWSFGGTVGWPGMDESGPSEAVCLGRQVEVGSALSQLICCSSV